MSIAVQEAGVEDIDTLVEMRLKVLRTVFEIPEHEDLSELAASNRRYYAEELETGNHIACLAYVNDELAGCAGACISNQMPSPECVNGLSAYIMNVYTEPEYRGRGIGTKTVAWLVEQIKARDITRISLQATSEGRSIYERLGFLAMDDFMEMLIE